MEWITGAITILSLVLAIVKQIQKMKLDTIIKDVFIPGVEAYTSGTGNTRIKKIIKSLAEGEDVEKHLNKLVKKETGE